MNIRSQQQHPNAVVSSGATFATLRGCPFCSLETCFAKLHSRRIAGLVPLPFLIRHMKEETPRMLLTDRFATD